MYLDRKFGLNLSLSEITLLFDLSLYLDRTLAQRKAKSKVKVAHCSASQQAVGQMLMNHWVKYATIRLHLLCRCGLPNSKYYVKFGQNLNLQQFKVIQGHRSWCQSKAHI